VDFTIHPRSSYFIAIGPGNNGRSILPDDFTVTGTIRAESESKNGAYLLIHDVLLSFVTGKHHMNTAAQGSLREGR
jgi:hypothetical protein